MINTRQSCVLITKRNRLWIRPVVELGEVIGYTISHPFDRMKKRKKNGKKKTDKKSTVG